MKIEDFELERFFAKYEFSSPYLLCCSDCESFTIEEILQLAPKEDRIHDKFLQQWLGYTESSGHPQLKTEIAKLYDKVKEEHVLVFAGAEEAIFIFFNVVLSAEDHVIVHDPCYQSLHEVANAIGCQVTKWQAKHEQNWDLDLEFLRKSIQSNTRAIVLNTPHNPTGYLMSQEKFSQVVQIAKEHNVMLFSDEVYKFLEHDTNSRLISAVDHDYVNTVTLGVMSKSLGLAGLRIGWVVTKNTEILKRMAAYKDYTTICSSGPSEFLSIVALQHKEKLLERNLRIVKSNMELLHSFFEKYSKYFEWVQPKAGSIAFPKLVVNVDVEKFCKDLIEKKGVLLLPSTCYKFGNRHFRMGFGRKNMPDALKKLEEYINEGHLEKLIEN